jgi:hypothetical protein
MLVTMEKLMEDNPAISPAFLEELERVMPNLTFSDGNNG